MNVSDFVTQRFGEDAAKYLKKIRIGGDSNQKGARYEDFFAVSKVCELTAKGLNWMALFFPAKKKHLSMTSAYE